MFGKKSLVEIQSSFTRAVEDLKSLIEDNEQEVERNLVEMERLKSISTALLHENDKAEKFKQNLEQLIG